MTTSENALVGRPRGFDTDEALERAMLYFWEHGYEGASLSDLEGAMGIGRTSMYAAFGNKEQLFRRALDRYAEGPASYTERALNMPTAREVATDFLTGAVQASTHPGRPPGCLTVQGALATGASGQAAHDLLATWRDDAFHHLHERFRRALDEGDLPPGTDARTLARLVMTVANGVAVQGASGASRAELQEVADAVLETWPSP